MPPPAERRRGFFLEAGLTGDFVQSTHLPVHPAPGLLLGGGFRIHPLIELGGGVLWEPALSSRNAGIQISDGSQIRGYTKFSGLETHVHGRVYPWGPKTARKTEPYLQGGMSWKRITPKSSGDRLTGTGWNLGIGAMHPITRHLFLDGRFLYRRLTLDQVRFQGFAGTLNPKITQNQFELAALLSFRL